MWLHGVVDGHARGDDSAGAVDVQEDVLVRILAIQVEELGDDQIGDVVVDGRAQKDDAVHEQTRPDVAPGFTPMGHLSDDRGVQKGLVHAVPHYVLAP